MQKKLREKTPVNSLVFDLDQFPKEDWLPTWNAWGSRIYDSGDALRQNARAYAFLGDKEAGTYVKDVLVRLSGWPNWTITKQGVTLNIMHLSPSVETKAVETPHYLYTLQRERPLKKEGMLTVSASTKNMEPLVIANLLTTTLDGVSDVVTEAGNGFVSGLASGKKFAFNTKPGNTYQVEDMQTDAAAISWSADKVKSISSDTPFSLELSANGIKYAMEKGGKITINVASKPSSVTLNGTPMRNFTYDSAKKAIVIEVPGGEGLLSYR